MFKINSLRRTVNFSEAYSPRRPVRAFGRSVWIAVFAFCFAGLNGGQARLATDETPVAGQTEPEFRLQGFLGEIDRVRLRPSTEKGEKVSCDTPSPDIDLVGMARRAMHYLINNPSPERGYEARFSISPLACPPSQRAAERDTIAEGDTENRMDWEFIFMREMTGIKEGKEVETAIWRRILGYIREDGLSWARPYALGVREGNPELPCAMNWTTGLTLGSLLERHERDGNPEHLKLARKLFLGLRSLANWDTGRAYYEGGLSGWRDGRWLLTGCSPHSPSILMAVSRYWEVTHDPDALAFARALADGQLAGLQPGAGDFRIRPDGSYGGSNCHLHVRAVIGAAHLGALTGDPRYVAWARSVYEFTRSMGTDWGWFPESPWAGNSETCTTGDMVDLARWLARAGHTEYWDHVERYVRNYVSQAQFFLTPEFRKIYRSANKDKPDAEVDAGLALLGHYEGGFIARVYPNDLARSRASDGMNMMGCCPPEAMRALHIAWSQIVTETKRGIEVNLAMNRDHPAAHVVSFLPHEGKVTVQARRNADFYLRPPSWTLRKAVQAYVDGKASKPDWEGAYVRFAGVKSGQRLTITYPLVDFSQRVTIAGKAYIYRWIGNTVLGVEPNGTILPLFANVPRPLPPISQ
jgi:hypothetical protein